MKKTTAVLWMTLLAPAGAGAASAGGKKPAASPPPAAAEDASLDDAPPDATRPPRMAAEAAKESRAAGEPPPEAYQPPPELAAEAAKEAAKTAAKAGKAKAADSSAEPVVSGQETAVGENASSDGGLPTEVVVKGQGSAGLKANKPPLNIEVDPFASIRESLKPDQQLLLAESPLTVVWRRTHPDFLKHDRVVQPWRTTFSERPGIVFSPRDQLSQVLQRKVEDKEAKGYQWSLTIADEEGKVFQHYEGSSRPPAELVWSGQNDQGEWLSAGRAYSPVYMFTDPGGTPYTRVGTPLRYKGVVHQERDGVHVSLDSAELWGKAKASSELGRDGLALMRSAADLIKRRYNGLPVHIEAYAASKDLAERQASAAADYLIKELMVLPQDVTTDSLRTPFSDQRMELILVNR